MGKLKECGGNLILIQVQSHMGRANLKASYNKTIETTFRKVIFPMIHFCLKHIWLRLLNKVNICTVAISNPQWNVALYLHNIQFSNFIIIIIILT